MKRALFLFAISTLISISPIPAQEIIVDNSHKLVVSGTAEIKAPADQASFGFSVVGYGKTLRQAVGNANNKITDISKKLFTIGVKENNLNTSRFYSGENEDGKAFLSSSKDFKAYMRVSVTLDSLSILEEIILTLSESDVEELSNIRFNIKDFTQLKQKARTQALDNAMLKARQMAEQTGVKLKKIINLSENTPIPYYYRNFSANSVMAMKAEDASGYNSSDLGRFFGESVSIVESVSLTYELE